APEGSWTVVRFGYTSTGSMNGPATAEGRGLECDKMDTSALNLHWRNYPQKLIDHAGKYAGNTFKFLLIDSWECGYQNWTARFADEFKKRRGYDLTEFIPALCGETVEDPFITEGFLYDFRKTIADLIGENYYKHFGDLCHEHGIEYHAEAIYGELNYPPLEIMKANSYIDLPMFEFWANTNDQSFVNYEPSPRPGLSFPASSAVIYDKPVIGTEAYTGMAHYSETPEALKPFGDRAYCMGLNQMILHSYVHQPLDKPAGMTLGQFAAHFNRLNPWWQFASGWIDYQSRIQYILQHGKVQHDLLYYIGDQLPQSIENPVISSLPFGYSGQACNADALENMITVSNGLLKLKDGQSYGMLILPANPAMELKTLERIKALVNDGATVYGEKPVRMLSLQNEENNRKAFDSIVDELWGSDEETTENTFGKGRVTWGKPIADVLAENHIQPAFSTGQPDSLNLMYIHKVIEGKDIFFVFNQRKKELNRECLFNTPNNVPEIWATERGTVIKPAVYKREDNLLRIPVSFKPYESKIFVFSHEENPEYITSVKKGDKDLFPSKALNDISPVPLIIKKGDETELVAENAGGYHLFNQSGKEVPALDIIQQDIEVDSPDVTIAFSPAYNQTISVVTENILKPLNDFPSPDIRYFAGTAKYNIQFDLPEAFLASSDSFLIKVNLVHATGSVTLNGKSLGFAWKPSTVFGVSGLKPKDNRLVIESGNPYRNRFIGDFRQYGRMENIWSSAPVGDFLHKESPLLENGVVGPVTVTGFGKNL
ncbi:MAG TPA: glycosyl hydrolase, partial [Bacteroidales bacterium]|nr:glycosyl hydrolase [Bacteroidales bacterium]